MLAHVMGGSIYRQAPLQLGIRRIARTRHDVLQKRFDAGHPFAQLRDVAGGAFDERAVIHEGGSFSLSSGRRV